MPPRLLWPLLIVALLLAAGVLWLARARPAAEIPALEQSQVPAEHPAPPARAPLESSANGERALEAATQPAPAVPPPQDLRAEGARREWQLPFGKGWWMDELVNPTGKDLDPAQIAALQKELQSRTVELNTIKKSRRDRENVYAQERIAAGLAVREPKAGDPVPPGKQPLFLTTHANDQSTEHWRIDIGPGDDGELDGLDKSLASSWCSAVEDLRARIAAAKH